MKFGLTEKNIELIGNVFVHYPQVQTVLIYGSRAKGNFKNGSDIDLTLEGQDLNLEIMNKISLDLDNLFLPYTFDLSIFKQIQNQDLIDHINKVGVVLYKR